MSLKVESPTWYFSDYNSDTNSTSSNNSPLQPHSSSSLSRISPAVTAAATALHFTNRNTNSNINDNNITSAAATTTPTSIHQEFLNALQARHQNSSAMGWSNGHSTSFSLPTTIYRQQHLEDLTPIDCDFLNELLNNQKSNNTNSNNKKNKILLIDVRSFSFYSKNRIQSSIHISIPSVLLKRPSYTLEKICEAITELDHAPERFRQGWQSAEYIVFYDHASYKPSDSGNSATAILLGSKLRQYGYKNQLNYLQGGFDKFSQFYPDQCQFVRLESLNKSMKRPSSSTLESPMVKKATTAAAQAATTTIPRLIPALPTSILMRPSFLSSSTYPANASVAAESSSVPNASRTTMSNPHNVNPFFDNIRQNLELSHGPLQERFSIRLPEGVENRNGALLVPNISNAYDMTSPFNATSLTPPLYFPRYGLGGSSVDFQGYFMLPSWLKDVMHPDRGPRKLAQAYEELERTEQKRLSTVMKYHSSQPAVCLGNVPDLSRTETTSKDYFPFSIVSGIEKGALNRYNNIWPYDYSRVKLKCLTSNNDNKDVTGGSQRCADDDKYINANYIQFATIKRNITLSSISKSQQEVQLEEDGLLSEASVRTMNQRHVELKSNRRYISTQGPLPTTFNSFWEMVWAENTHVIVMLTQEMEMNKIKCHRYWPSTLNKPQQYGPFSITLLSESTELVQYNSKASSFSSNDSTQEDEDDCIIIRKFLMTYNDGHQSSLQQRNITQLQYTGWTDFGVPDHPVGLLQLIHLTDQYHKRSCQQPNEPVIVHCSAGCGRSGAFCVIDTMIQRLCQENDLYTSSRVDKILETIGRFREQRMSMVQTHRQFVFCYEAVLWWLLGFGYLPTSSPLSPLIATQAHQLQLPQPQQVKLQSENRDDEDDSSDNSITATSPVATPSTDEGNASLSSLGSIVNDFQTL